jgi:hypothetical protein
MTNTNPWGQVKKTCTVFIGDMELVDEYNSIIFVTDASTDQEFTIDAILTIGQQLEIDDQLVWGTDEFKVVYYEYTKLLDKSNGEPKRELISIEKYREYTYLVEGNKHKLRFNVIS